NRRVGEERVAQIPLDRGATLDLSDDGGIEADADVEQVAPAVDVSEPDRLDAAEAGTERGEQLAGRLNRVVGHSYGSGEHVGRASGKHTQRTLGPGQPVRSFVQGPVATEHYHGVGSLRGCPLCEMSGVPGPARLGDAYFVVRSERLLDHNTRSCRDRRRGRVDDQKEAQALPPAGYGSSALNLTRHP